MTKEEILEAFRLIAMGRINGDAIERLAELLATKKPAAVLTAPVKAD